MIPVVFEWTGEVMKPVAGFGKACDRQFVVHERYRMEVVQQRSSESHRHFFAVVNEAFENIPEQHAGRWPTPDHLRRWALIQAGFRNETTYIAGSKAEALRIGTFLRSIDEFAYVEVKAKTATLYRAKSQSYSEMSRKEFGESKQAVLDVLAKLIGVETDELAKHSGRAA